MNVSARLGFLGFQKKIIENQLQDSNLTAMNIYIIFIWISAFYKVAPLETCHFPDFVQSPSEHGNLKPWTTRVWWLFIRHVPQSAEKQDITIKNGHMTRYRELNHKSCERTSRRVHHKTRLDKCSERQHVFNRTCISEEGENTFKVIQYNADRSHRFTCMKFVRRSDNVVQVYEGPLNDLNEKNLCDESGLHLDEWPWTAQVNNEASFCAVSGGFSFRTIRRLTNEDLCEDEWRRSTLEIECMKGDGMDFMAPHNSNCNPFLRTGDWKRLSCWAGWTQGDFIFIIASDLDSEPRYCLRFPRNQVGEFSVMVYFSVICPTEPDGKPPHGIEYYELKMFRKDTTQCKDEDEGKCKEQMTPELCAKDTTTAPHCQETCGRCPAATISALLGRRCWLDPQLYGEWKLHEKTRTYDVIVDKEKAVFAHMGTFICLEVESKKQRYKMVSLFDNGCSHRYTCVEFMRRNNNVLQYRTSPSDRSELKMEDLCNFRDDPYPLSDLYRSFYFKNVILAKDLWPQYCGLNSVISFNGTVNGRACSGNVSDWDDETCSTRGVLTLQSDTCKELILPAGFQCLAFIYDNTVPLQQILLTRSLDGKNSYNCWVLTKYVSGVHWQRPLLLQMPTIQCSLIMDVQLDDKMNHGTKLYLDDAAKSKPCKPVDARSYYVQHNPHESNTSDHSYQVQNKQEDESGDDTQVHLQTSSVKPSIRPPTQTPPANVYHSTDFPFWGLESGCSGSVCSDTFVRLLWMFIPVYWLLVSSACCSR